MKPTFFIIITSALVVPAFAINSDNQVPVEQGNEKIVPTPLEKFHIGLEDSSISTQDRPKVNGFLAEDPDEWQDCYSTFQPAHAGSEGVSQDSGDEYHSDFSRRFDDCYNEGVRMAKMKAGGSAPPFELLKKIWHNCYALTKNATEFGTYRESSRINSEDTGFKSEDSMEDGWVLV
ncbi:hypothetical protein JCM33374_g629 [Metschnikowia sp. JCM 33374]|nr:hypothetical protein JCM33374_g629 [Metschnikowia sp. JCM 33374]